MLGALMMQGYHSSPLLFENQPVQVYIIIFWLDRSEYLHGGCSVFGGIRIFSKISGVPNTDADYLCVLLRGYFLYEP